MLINDKDDLNFVWTVYSFCFLRQSDEIAQKRKVNIKCFYSLICEHIVHLFILIQGLTFLIDFLLMYEGNFIVYFVCNLGSMVVARNRFYLLHLWLVVLLSLIQLL